MRVVFAIAIASGCGFAPGSDGDPIDAAIGDPTIDGDGAGAADAAADGSTVDATPCTVETDDGAIVDRGRVGSTNGSPGLPVSCDAPGDVVVGIALQISDGNTLYGARSSHGIRLACAPLAIDPGGAVIVGAEYTRDRSGSGAEGWSPSTWTPLAHCTPGSAISGFRAHLGDNSNLFVNATVKCSAITASGTPGGTVEVLDVPDSLTDPLNPEQVDCAGNEILRRFETRTGSGLDAVNLMCAPTRCGS